MEFAKFSRVFFTHTEIAIFLSSTATFRSTSRVRRRPLRNPVERMPESTFANCSRDLLVTSLRLLASATKPVRSPRTLLLTFHLCVVNVNLIRLQKERRTNLSRVICNVSRLLAGFFFSEKIFYW